MKKRKIIAATLVLLLLLQLLTACAGARYGAALYSDVGDWIDEAFLKENKVKGAYYRNENYTEENRYEEKEWLREKEGPSSRTFVVTTEEEYGAIFPNATLDVDFEKQMVILYLCTDTSPRDYYIEEMKMHDDALNVTVKLESGKPGVDDSDPPHLRCMMLVMKNIIAMIISRSTYCLFSFFPQE